MAVLLGAIYETRLYLEAFQESVAEAHSRAGQRVVSTASATKAANPTPTIVISDTDVPAADGADDPRAAATGAVRSRANTADARGSRDAVQLVSPAWRERPGDDTAVSYTARPGPATDADAPTTLAAVDTSALKGLLEMALDALAHQVRRGGRGVDARMLWP